jgi:hypothetical protein
MRIIIPTLIFSFVVFFIAIFQCATGFIEEEVLQNSPNYGSYLYLPTAIPDETSSSTLPPETSGTTDTATSATIELPPQTDWMAQRSVIINEVNWAGSVIWQNNDQFIELKNVSGGTVDVTDWKLYYASNHFIELTGTMDTGGAGIRIYQRGYGDTLHESRYTVIPSTNPQHADFWNNLYAINGNNAQIWLEDATGKVMDSFGDPNGQIAEELGGYSHGDGANDEANGFGFASAIRVNDELPGNDPSAWGDSEKYNGLRSFIKNGNAMTPGYNNLTGDYPAPFDVSSGVINEEYVGLVVSFTNARIMTNLVGAPTEVLVTITVSGVSATMPGEPGVTAQLKLRVNLTEFPTLSQNDRVNVTEVPLLCPTTLAQDDHYYVIGQITEAGKHMTITIDN